MVFKRLAPNNHVAKRWIKVTFDHKFEVANIKSDIKSMRKYYNILVSNQWNKEHDVAMELHRGLLELAEGNYEIATNSIRKYLHKIHEEKAIKKESVTRIYYYLGLAYYKNGDINQARKTWEELMSMDDEPGNHAFKRMTRKQLLLL
jgi:tetratricopeptide (TPR) repeat protein